MLPARSPPNLERMRLSVCTDLPAEILHAIFSQLDGPRDLHRSSLVCKEWRSAATDDRLWESYFWAFYRPIDGEKKLQQYFTRKRRAGMRAWFKQANAAALESTAQHLPMPPFLVKMARSTIQFPDFYRLFSSRLNADDRLLEQLCGLVQSSSHTLDGLSKIIGEHQDRARHLFAALVATQPIDVDNVGDFVPRDDTSSNEDASWPRALDVHAAAAHSQKLPIKPHCLSLHLTALKALGHLQRREGIASLQALRNKGESFDTGEQEDCSISRERILRCCKGLETGLEDVALFRSGDKSEVRDYLDLLALFVWVDVHAEQQRPAVRAAQSVHREGLPTLPRGSTRDLLSRIITSLRTLGYATADKPLSHDIDNAFINLALYCPIQRETSSLTFASIVCFVARRLGIAATLSNVAAGSLIVANEDSPVPALWEGEHEATDWPRFWVETMDPKSDGVWELNEAVWYLDLLGHGDRQPGEKAALLEPASPLDVLMRIAGELMLYSTEDKIPITRGDTSGRPLLEDTFAEHRSVNPELLKLQHFLEGRGLTPPAPLVPTRLPASLASLPPTEPGHKVSKHSDQYPQDGLYCARWILRLIEPDRVGGIDASSEALALTIPGTVSGLKVLDYGPLIELDWQRRGRGAAEGLKWVPSAAGEWSENGTPPEWFTKWLRPFLDCDAKKGIGMGCAGSFDFDELQRPLGVDLPRQFLDPSHEANREVKLRVGTVIRHQTDGRKGVIVGWDTACRACECWIQATSVDELPLGGRHQPFYQIIMDDMSECYEAQCLLKGVTIPSGSTREDAVAVLQNLVPLFNVRSLGKAFRTLAVEPWAELAAVRDAGGKDGESKGMGESREAEQDEHVEARREPGQVYLVMNAWMREAWPYN